MAEQDTPPPTITTMKIPIIKKGEYDIWSMRMRQYICHTDHNLWDIIFNGDLQEEPAPTRDQSGPSAPPVPKTTKQLAAKRNQERVKSILLLAIPDEYLLKFHNVPDANSLWEAIKSKFGGNEESKKMQKNVLKHQFENFTTASNESMDKAYDRFLISTDKPKITRKQSKASKRGHENQKSTKPKPQKTKALANFHLQGPFLQFPKVLYNLKERKERQGPNVQSHQSSTVLTVEEGAGTPFTIHRLLRFHPHGKTRGKSKLEGALVNSRKRKHK
ncbi:hypothetical protein Tco_1416655 [Tanacetum coccineum]